MRAWSDLTLSLGDLINRRFRSRGSWMEKLSLIWGIVAVTCVFPCLCLYRCYGICPRCSQRAAQQAASALVNPWLTAQGTLQKRGVPELVRAAARDGVLEEVTERT